MADNAQVPNDAPATEETPAAPPTRSPGHRGTDVRDAVAEMTARAHEISLEAGSKMAAAMKDVINAAAGLAGFAIESARDLVQYMVRRGQMTQDEADKLLRDAEEAHARRKAAEPAAAPGAAPVTAARSEPRAKTAAEAPARAVAKPVERDEAPAPRVAATKAGTDRAAEKTPERAQEIERAVNRVLSLFERVGAQPKLESVLDRELEDLATLMGESRTRRRTR
jgi:hypothetical protein